MRKLRILILLLITANAQAGSISHEFVDGITDLSIPIKRFISNVSKTRKSNIIIGIMRGVKSNEKLRKQTEGMSSLHRRQFLGSSYTVLILGFNEEKNVFESIRLAYDISGNLLEQVNIQEDKSFLEVNELYFGAKSIDQAIDALNESFNSPFIRSLFLLNTKDQMPYYQYQIAADNPEKGSYELFQGKMDATTGRILTKRGD